MTQTIGTVEPKNLVLAELIMDETAKETMLRIAADCDRFAVRAAMRSIYELAVSRVIDETKGS